MCWYVGCGVNVTNKDPTICINDLLHLTNDLESGSRPDLESGSQPEPFSVEELIARSVSVLEELVDKFETDDWRQILDLYYAYWLHRHVISVWVH